MTLTIRSATLSDIETLSALLLNDAQDRHAMDPDLWALECAALDKLGANLRTTMEAENPPFRQKWLVADAGGAIVGVAHTILLPVPPIYAGEFGPPGLIMEDCYVSADAPPETQAALLHAAEADLIEAGAEILLGSSAQGGAWQAEYLSHGYDPLTLYFAKTGLRENGVPEHVRKATAQDVPAIVALSAVHRKILNDLHSDFWKPHVDADARFGSWMTRSLTLTDRDMFVSDTSSAVQGYAISHPATPLHFPTAHDISGVGVIDDYYHTAIENPDELGADAPQAEALFETAEAARVARGNTSVIVVCPAAWGCKIEMLEQAGYRIAITWYYKKIG